MDDEFWPHTSWRALIDKGEIQAVCLTYTRDTVPVIVILSHEQEAIRELLAAILEELPSRFSVHVNEELVDLLRRRFQVVPFGTHFKMGLRNRQRIQVGDFPGTLRLGPDNLQELERFYDRCFPESYFRPWMLNSGLYFGIRSNGKLISVAGTHICSRTYKIAAIGNVVTDASFRNRGYCQAVTGKLCAVLEKEMDHIGLNVRADNAPAIVCYERLGFEIVGVYFEGTCSLERVFHGGV